jgi:two-component system, sensor histidine kinase and response regulator
LTASEQLLRVAIVDDEEPLCLAVQRILGKYRVHVEDVGVEAAFECTHFLTGEQFLEGRGDRPDFDLLLLDLKLPGMSGLDLLAELSEQGQSVLTVMITAYATFETAVLATKLGAYDFLPKPFSPEELRYAVRKATDQLILSREARRLAEEKRQVRFNFISVLAHELKAPINAIEGYLKILEADEPPQRRRMVDRSLARLEGMRKLILDLLDLTRIESGHRERSLARLDVRTSAQAAIDLFAAEASERGITMLLEAPEAVEMVADPGEIEIVFNNLVSNAVKYNRPGGTVAITINRENGVVTIAVSDTGIGMTPEESSRLFSEFVRIRNEDTANVLGSGLGLSTVRKLAQLYGGDVTVDSARAVGTTFTVSLRDDSLDSPNSGAAISSDE